jgi:polyribonucleotide nucleotidyltransferase
MELNHSEAHAAMFRITRHQFDWGSHPVILETGLLARQAQGAVLVSSGKARILCTVTTESQPASSFDFVPLSVHYLEKAFAAGKIPGGFVKRESKASDHEILISRLIDRAIRPLIDKDWHHETQLVCTVFSHDADVDMAMLALLGASAAVNIAGIPWSGPVAGIRLCHDTVSGWIAQSGGSQRRSSDVVIASTSEGTVMVECQLNEHSVDEVVMALDSGHRQAQHVISHIRQFVAAAGIQPLPFHPTEHHQVSLAQQMHDLFASDFHDIVALDDRAQQDKQIHVLQHTAITHEAFQGHETNVLKYVFLSVWKQFVRHRMLRHSVRLDGRGPADIRSIHCQSGVLPMSHGSALFTRGLTQALVSVVLAGKEDAQTIDGLNGVHRDPFLLHYNFPSFSVGEVGRMGPAGRREIGHGKLAWRALQAVLPPIKHTVRIVSDILESNGSSSMATICGASLALADAGLQLVRPVAGIAMGCVHEGSQFLILSDISGQEDHMGDMDFKVAGTTQGLTALQMDLKGCALSTEFLRNALNQAVAGLAHILHSMDTQTGPTPLDQRQGPVIQSITIPVESIKDLIGSGGRTIRQLCEETQCKIDIGDGGEVSVFAPSGVAMELAMSKIGGLTGTPELGQIYSGHIVGIKDFGLFVSFGGFAKDGMVHISEISNVRVDNIQDLYSVGETVSVKVLDIDATGRIKLSIKQVESSHDKLQK